MEAILESTLEAQLFKYMSFGFLATVDGFVTCVAVLTAAISLWGIKAVGFTSARPKSSTSSNASQAVSNPSWLIEPLEESAASECSCSSFVGEEHPTMTMEPLEEPQISGHSISFSDSDDGEEDGGVKGKFMLYFESDNKTSDTMFEEMWVDGFGCVDDEVCCSWESWDWEVKRRLEHPGWYRCQDLRVLDGSVVRLWDDVKGTRPTYH